MRLHNTFPLLFTADRHFEIPGRFIQRCHPKDGVILVCTMTFLLLCRILLSAHLALVEVHVARP